MTEMSMMTFLGCTRCCRFKAGDCEGCGGDCRRCSERKMYKEPEREEETEADDDDQ